MKFVNENFIDEIIWSTRWWNRCKARSITNVTAYTEIQCERMRYHLGDHANSADGQIVLWTTLWVGHFR